MNQEHVISDEILEQALVELSRRNYWIAYNTIPYFLEKGDVSFFKDKSEATEFAINNLSEFDNYKTIYASSLTELLRQIPYGENFSKQVSNPDKKKLYQTEGNAFTDSLSSPLEQQSISKNKNLSIMNEKNLDYLKDNMKYMGFGDSMNEALETHLKHGQPEFRISHQTVVNKKPFEVELHFRKSDNTDMYFFNSYNASLQRSNGEKVDQTFYLNKGKGITAKEAYNLLEGRAVHKELTTKEGQEYKAWVQLDFDKMDKHNNHEVKQFHENYGYDLRAAVEKFAVTDLLDTDKEKALMQSLQKGNVQSVTIEKDGQVSKMFMEANPQFKMVTLYDAQMKRVPKEDLGQYQSVKQTENKEVSQEQKEDIKKDVKQKNSEDLNGTKKKSSRKKGQSV